ncbi:phosphoribosylanthranilate isomerase [Candidatus Micrarchaeota archaeon]|nr:phosphoribosylanthranilate isomerase [Candidatus Micrarchaeota archaeon]
MKAKICGIMREEDAELAAGLGADFLGVVMAPESKRSISAQEARRILSCVSIPGVVVTTHSSLEELQEIAGNVAPSYLQLHSDVPVDVLEGLAGETKLIKTLRAVAGREIGEYTKLMREYAKYSEFFLLDGEKGGSGKTIDWGMCAKIVAAAPKPVFLAGGLNPENVREAIGVVRPFGVDVSSGVEECPGKKSAEKMRRFIEVANNG